MPGPRKFTYLSIEPLERLLGFPTANEIGRPAGATRCTVQQWRQRGLSVYAADRVATAHGFHPTEIWGDQFYTAQGARA